MKLVFYTLTLCLMISCGAAKNDIIANDLTSGTIVYSELENDCTYTIKVTDSLGENLFYDPINLDDSFMKDNLNVKFKFKTLRMKNRCDRANPISISFMAMR